MAGTTLSLPYLNIFFFFLYGSAAHIGPWAPLCEVLAGFKPTIPVFKRAKTFHGLDRAATVTGIKRKYRGFIFTTLI
jgi:hypothetical protein